MRFTHVRAKLESNEENHHEETPKIRMKNYRGATSKSFGDVNKSPFGRNNVPYSSGEGYYKKGGHIHYFSSDWDIDAANTYFNNLVEDGLFNDEFLALTMEVGIQIIHRCCFTTRIGRQVCAIFNFRCTSFISISRR